MVNLKHLFTNRNCPTLDRQLYEDIGVAMEYETQKFGEFPPRDRLYEREENPNVYKENPILRNLFEHYQPFFEKGIDYSTDGKTWNVYPTGSMLWYCNEAFSLCTKLSIDPYPEHYFMDQYYKDIGGGCTQVERYFVLSIVYALLAVNWRVRRQHLKMMDVLYNFLSKGCPLVIMVKSIEFITQTYADNNAIDYEFRPLIDRWGYTLLKVDEGLIEDDEEQMELFTQMRMKVCENGIKYGEKFNFKPGNNLPEGLHTEEGRPMQNRTIVQNGSNSIYVENNTGPINIGFVMPERIGVTGKGSDAYFNNIANQIIKDLDEARVSIHVAIAWFTNQRIADKLVEKKKEGLDVKVVYFKDYTNCKFGVDLDNIPFKTIRGTRGGIMHNKFCVIDNQKVITGSYNWSENAENKNDENATVVYDNDIASHYSVEFRRLFESDSPR